MEKSAASCLNATLARELVDAMVQFPLRIMKNEKLEEDLRD